VTVDAVQLVAGVQAAVRQRLDVVVVLAQGVGHEQRSAHIA
jgi:hypothetical protein